MLKIKKASTFVEAFFNVSTLKQFCFTLAAIFMWTLRFFLVCALGFRLSASASSNDEPNSASGIAESCEAVIRIFPIGIGVGVGKLNNTNSVVVEGDAKSKPRL